jgi:hypothetical protein
MSTTTALSAIQKVFYVEDTLHKQFNQRSVLYDKLWKKWETDASGKTYTYAALTSGLSNAGSGMSEGGDFPASAAVGTQNIIVPDTQLSTPVELSGRVIKAATGSNKGAFVSAVRLTVEQAMKSTMHSINRQLHSDGTDALAFCVGNDDATPALFDDGQGNPFVHIPKSGVVTCDLIDAASNEAGQTVNEADMLISRGAAGAASVSLSWTSGAIDTASADGDYLVLANTIGKQMMGIRGVISASDPPLLSTTGLHGLTVASKPYWTAQVFANPAAAGTPRALTLEIMQQPLTAIQTETDFSADDVKFLLTNGGVFNKYIALCVENKRHVNQMTLDGGQTAVSFNNKPLILDPQCRQNTIYYIVPESMSVLTSSGGVVWADFQDGSQWQKKVGTAAGTYADAYQAFLVFYGNLACKVRNANAVLLDITQ